MSYRSSHVGRGTDYHQTFSALPRRAVLWRIEQDLLPALVQAHFDRPPTHLDFACGTGRFLGLLQPHVASSTGVDIAASMLEEAGRNAPGAELIEADLTANDKLGDRQFDLITAFRFFPNAEPELRSAVMKVLVRHLAPGGRIVFNNHCTDASFYARGRALLRRPPGPLMRRTEVDALLAECGLNASEVRYLGVLPLTDYRHPFPRGLAERAERVLSHAPGVSLLAEEAIYVCAKA